jgi:hypothetical protein
MHSTLRKAAGFCVLPLLGGALAVAASAPPASAQTWQDTSLAAYYLQATPTTVTGAVVNGVVSGTGKGSTLSFAAPNGEFFTAPVLTQGSPATDATLTTNSPHSLVLTSGGTVTGSATLGFTINSATSGVTITADETVKVTESVGTLGESATPTSVPGEAVTVSFVNNNATGAVEFTGTVTKEAGPVTFSESNLPAGLVSGNPLKPGTAVPGNYGGVVYTATDPLGSTFSGTFSLQVSGHEVVPPAPMTNYGDMVNVFGNGFDAYQQQHYPGAIVAGWTATQADPATHFIRLPGTVPGAYKFEYAPNGVASGLCVSDPGGGWASDPLPDGLILTVSNNGPWQQFIPQPDGTLRNVATGLIVSPNGTGAQLRGTTAAVLWGGSAYTWTDYAHLPW